MFQYGICNWPYFLKLISGQIFPSGRSHFLPGQATVRRQICFEPSYNKIFLFNNFLPPCYSNRNEKFFQFFLHWFEHLALVMPIFNPLVNRFFIGLLVLIRFTRFNVTEFFLCTVYCLFFYYSQSFFRFKMRWTNLLKNFVISVVWKKSLKTHCIKAKKKATILVLNCWV